jgi:hypothetical protein
MNLTGEGAKPLVPLWQIILSILLAVCLLLYLDSRGLSAEYLPSSWIVTLTQSKQLPFVVWALLLPLFLLVKRQRSTSLNEVRSADLDRPSFRSRVTVSVLFGLIGFGVAVWFGWDLRNLPPRVHDEYSYLLQAETFLAGRLHWPAPPAAEHFHEVHVLMADGVLASRYFPATGAWIAPFLALGVPMLAGWLAQGIVSGFMVAAASRWSLVAGITTGIFVSTCPALVIFGNTYLSPHPTMMGLVIAWWVFQESFYSRGRWLPILVGVAVGWAFLARPLTAVAIAGPWGLYAIWRSIESQEVRAQSRWMIAGFLPAVLFMAIYNQQITGDIGVTPYGKYTAVYTPSHVYGFYNRTRGFAAHEPRTIDAYEAWVAELTPRRAAFLFFHRWEKAIPWIGGCVPVATLLLLALFQCRGGGDRILLPALSILTLSMAYVPYFFEGVMGFSYIVEAVPWVLLLMGYSFSRVFESWKGEHRHALAFWWSGVVVVASAMNMWVILPEAFAPNGEFVQPRLEAAERITKEIELCGGERCLILYDISQRSDLHVMWVHNHPSFDGQIIRAFVLDDPSPVLASFPKRKAFYFHNGVYREAR